jgi:hypothetical protein
VTAVNFGGTRSNCDVPLMDESALILSKAINRLPCRMRLRLAHHEHVQNSSPRAGNGKSSASADHPYVRSVALVSTSLVEADRPGAQDPDDLANTAPLARCAT